ncbi:MAG: serine/threonine-protein kinase [Elusimicrobiota bacterium]
MRRKAAILGILAALSLAAAAEQKQIEQMNAELSLLAENMQRLRSDIAPAMDALEEMQPQYEKDDSFVQLTEKHEQLAGGIHKNVKALKLEVYKFTDLRDRLNVEKVQSGIMQGLIKGKMPDDYDDQFKTVMADVALSSKINEFLTGVGERLENDERLFKQAEKRLKDRTAMKWMLGGGGIGLLVIGLILALFYQTRRIQKTQIARLVTPDGAALTTPPQKGAPVPALEGPAPGSGKALVAGDVLEGIYRIEKELGRGGMGVVYEATDVALNRKVAIKHMLREIAQQADELALFLSEARMVASLKHPNLVEIYNILRNQGQLYMVFEHVAGHPLSRYLEGRRRLSVRSVKQTVRQTAAALDYAHSMKVIHRDLKPANIMISGDGTVKVMDFGIAYQAKMTVAKVTQANPWGTPAYMAPEQELGKISRESDLFALGVLLYETLSGVIPFPGPNFLAQKQRGLYTPITQMIPALPKAVDVILTRALAPDPRDRYHTAGEFAAAVDRIPEAAASA